ncbi:ornithine cyclodeaminase family protein [Flavilitoribacter nigricans]|uniref:Ornithine cyclodeaminase n=1 Tax=Flavilitoribacter nigricans (strain ATCC 23147 / DSM 23189 / NBRC 102662 / NCIMB 1420 / SS-2) TaxID=1122177 RepID=A0A2D0NJE1_FLAN2|nr:ornithine cyclodeaminase family protein [Flavilitoribacter nigricans]PHN08614.1 ornithine cyclodeaminase [Flavilitoribacter nigricans DSM 23189 = NBRC 102662]
MPKNTETLILSHRDIEKIVLHFGLNYLMDQLIEKMIHAFQSYDEEQTIIPVRSGFHYQQPVEGLVEWMPIHQLGRQVLVKTVGYHPKNPAELGLPTIVSTIATYDTRTGHLQSLVDGIFLTAFRTGAASAVASKYLADPESSTLGLIGCGSQAVSQLHALSRIFDFELVWYYDTDEQAMATFPDRCSCLDLSTQFVPGDIAQIVGSAEIISTATSIEIGAGPLFFECETLPHVHINAVGSDFPGKIEIPVELLRRSFVCPDFLEQALVEGECQQLEPADIAPDIIEVIKNRNKYQDIRHQRSIFDSTGLSLEDMVVTELFLDCAQQLNLGTPIEIENHSEDALNPYHFLQKHAPVSGAAAK